MSFNFKATKDSEVQGTKETQRKAQEALTKMKKNEVKVKGKETETKENEQQNNNGKVIKRAEKRERVAFSFKLDAEDADKLITYYMTSGDRLTDIIEESILKTLKKEKVQVDNELVKEYYEQKQKKKIKANQNKEIRKKMKEYEEKLKQEMQK